MREIEKKIKRLVLKDAVARFGDETLTLDDVETVWSCSYPVKKIENLEWLGILHVNTIEKNDILYTADYFFQDQPKIVLNVYDKIDSQITKILI